MSEKEYRDAVWKFTGVAVGGNWVTPGERRERFLRVLRERDLQEVSRMKTEIEGFPELDVCGSSYPWAALAAGNQFCLSCRLRLPAICRRTTGPQRQR